MRSSGLKDRTVHLVDLENVVGTGHVTEWAARRARAVYMATGVVTPGDHVIVGISHHNRLAAGFGWSDARPVVRSGPDAADLALQEVMATEHLEARFGACLLVTGDGGFAHPVAALIGLGLPVAVVAPKGRLSAALRLAASTAFEIDFNPDANTSWSA
jgi:hypothetical protein